jgi:hypothetical protein
MFGRVSEHTIASTAMNPGGVSFTVREIAPGICTRGPQGAIAVGTPTERSGARSHPVAYSRGAHRLIQSDVGCINERIEDQGMKDQSFADAGDMVMPVIPRVPWFSS